MPSFPTCSRICNSVSKPNRKCPKRLPRIFDNFPTSVLKSKGHLKEAVYSLDLLVEKGIRLNHETLAFLLNQCANYKSLQLGKLVHLHLKITGFKRPGILLGNHLIHMYGKCGDCVEARRVFDKMGAKNIYSWNNMLSGYARLGMLKPARKVFDKMPKKDIVSWNTMVIAHAHQGLHDEALKFYMKYRRLNIGLNDYSFAGIATVCVKLKDLRLTKQVHCQVFVSGFLLNEILVCSIVDAYAKSGELVDARRLFDQMERKDVLAWTTLVSGYAKWGDMKSAKALFDAMPEKNPVSWTTMISGYARNNMGHKAVELFAKMMMLRVKPDQFTFSSCLSACASIASLGHGKQIHARLTTSTFDTNSIIVSSLIDMYAKCGCLEDARKVFDFMGDKQDVVLWNTLIYSLALHGCGEEASRLYGKMVSLGVRPDKTTFLVLLSACSHSGLVNEGINVFESMATDHNIVPDQEHYACLMNILGRAGRFDDVMNQLKKMPYEPDSRVWNSILSACCIHGNVELGKLAAKHLHGSDSQVPASFVSLSSIYGALGKWESVEKIRQLMKDTNVRKEQALSWLEIDHTLPQDFVADRVHLPSGEANSDLEPVADPSSKS